METEPYTIYSFKEGDLFDNRYRLVKLAGSGGFADVWKAEDSLRKNRVVALKIYTRLDEEGIKQMSEEYDETEYIQHPNLLTGNHFATVGNIPYLEMRYCDGGSMVRKVGRISNEELRHMLCDVVNGLAYLHKEGVVHQDIKPDNILYDSKHDTYLLADFGISSKTRTRLSKSAKFSDRVYSRTSEYAPPEKFSGNMVDAEPDIKGDIFSLGMTLFELAVGKLPFDPPMAAGREMFYSQGRLQLDYSKIQDAQFREIVELCTKYRKEERPTAEMIVSMLNELRKGYNSVRASWKATTEKINIDSQNNEANAPRKPTDSINKSYVGERSTQVKPKSDFPIQRCQQRDNPFRMLKCGTHEKYVPNSVKYNICKYLEDPPIWLGVAFLLFILSGIPIAVWTDSPLWCNEILWSMFWMLSPIAVFFGVDTWLILGKNKK